MTACLYEKETTRYEDIRTMHSIVGKVVNKILSSGVLRNCTFNVRRDIILIQDLRNSSCPQTQEDSYEDENLPICSGHNYGLIKCRRRNGMNLKVYILHALFKGNVQFECIMFL